MFRTTTHRYVSKPPNGSPRLPATYTGQRHCRLSRHSPSKVAKRGHHKTLPLTFKAPRLGQYISSVRNRAGKYVTARRRVTQMSPCTIGSEVPMGDLRHKTTLPLARSLFMTSVGQSPRQEGIWNARLSPPDSLMSTQS